MSGIVEHTPLPNMDRMEDLVREYGMAEMSCGHDMSGAMDRCERDATKEELLTAIGSLVTAVNEHSKLLERVLECEELMKMAVANLDAAANLASVPHDVSAALRIVANRLCEALEPEQETP